MHKCKYKDFFPPYTLRSTKHIVNTVPQQFKEKGKAAFFFFQNSAAHYLKELYETEIQVK